LSEVVEKIVAEIRKQGAISMARFMELALYCPVYGYYEKEEDKIGRRGDYYTSVSVGRLFGELLACQFAQWLEEGPGSQKCQESGADCHASGQEVVEGLSPKSKVQSPKFKVQSRSLKAQAQTVGGRLQIVEAGAHRGELAGDILRWLREWRGDLYERLEYCIAEPSERRRGWQRTTLTEFTSKLRWVNALAELDTNATSGAARTASRIIFSNELLDAMPVHRLGWNAKERTWFEWAITFEDGRFVWTRMPGPRDLVPGSSPLDAVLPDGFTREVSPAAAAWWREAARVLRRGWLLTFDYGFTSEENFVPERPCGTLRGYFRQMLAADILTNPGEQDITAHVDFSAIQQIGESVGLQTEAFVTQAQFLTRIAEKVLSGAVRFGDWTPERTRQFHTLTHPQHLGRAFRVLVQARRAKSSAIGKDNQ
jgi:SAM-dependent MidA family methyltransferase